MSEHTKSTLQKLVDDRDVGVPQLELAFEEILSGSVDPIVIAGFLVALRRQAETVDHISAGARVLRRHARTARAPVGAVDTCGTGGLGWTSLNTSTAAAIVAASAGVPIAKHGNRSVPPKTGSADVLETLGVNLTLSEGQIERCFERAGLAFLFAQAHHSAMRHVGPVRKALGIRTIFNLLGPLSNPAGAKRQVLGVARPEWGPLFAAALNELGSERVWVVHGIDGIDEISTSGPTQVVELKNGALREFILTPDSLGVPTTPLDQLRGGTPAENAAAIRSVLKGEPSPFSDIVCVNAAAALIVGERAQDIREGIEMCRQTIKDGAAERTLSALVEASNGN